MTFLVDQSAYLSQLELFPIPYSHHEKELIRAGLRVFSQSYQSIPYPVACRFFQFYKKLYWKGSHLISQIQAGYIEREDTVFRVVFDKAISRGYILSHPEDQYQISFRHAREEWNLDPICHISIASK